MRKKSLQNKLSEEMLKYEYNLCGSMQKMAIKLNVSIDTIYKYMKLYQLQYKKHYDGIYKCDENLFYYDTEKSFYWAGFIAADGSVQKRKYSKILKITLSSKDISHLEKFRDNIKSNHPIKIYIIKPSKLIPTTNEGAELQIVSNKIYDDLKRFNIMPNKTKIYDMPDWLINHQLVHHFMRGYFDGDGCISTCGLGKGRKIKQGSWSIMGTKNFIQNYKKILINSASLTDAKITNHGSIFQINYSGNGNMKKIFEFLYKNSSIYLERKSNKLMKYFTYPVVVPKFPNGALTIT